MTTESSRESFRSDLVECLRRLAAPAGLQTQYLRTLGVYPSADELALELHELALVSPSKAAAGELTIAEQAAVARLDRQIESFSGSQNQSLWVAAALATADEWKQVRTMASECLGVFGAT